ncbi:Carboxypeptidase S1-like protein [Lachnellula arida]|uniref:Carboxypeptidase S1-like protein n=1 Tax=Lachnellula arida TaxID=1316785 RepID=A0A8T9BQS3_9HELO|nr:Carboxypeptidase S1-like protein [Lachnellula arida]
MVFGQYFPPTPEGITVVNSRFGESITISYKETPQCSAGTFPSLNSKNTANSTGNAAPAVWTFLQAWLRDFHMCNSPNNELSIWAESYGGHWGSGLASFIEKQNDKIAAGALGRAKVINLDTLVSLMAG